MPAARRIGFDAIRALQNRTGLGNYARGVLRGLRRHDAELELHLYAPAPPRAEFRTLPAELGARLHLPAGRHAWPMARMLWRTFRLGRVAATDRVQLYHGLTHEIPRDLPRTRIPSVVTFHDLIYERHPELFPRFDRWSYRWRYRWSAQHATAIVAVSGSTRDALVVHYGIDVARIAVIPPARDPIFAIPVARTERATACARYQLPDQFLLSVGTLEPRKNHQVLIRAMAQLPPGAAPPLVLVGRDGGSAGRLRSLAAELGLGGRVRFLTDVGAGDLPAILQCAAIFLYPSRIEGFGMPIVEALSAGVPVIAASGDHLVDAGGPETRHAAPDDPAEWVATIVDVLDDAEAADRMRRAGVVYARRFEGNRLAARLAAIYDAVLAGDPLPATPPMDEVAVEQNH